GRRDVPALDLHRQHPPGPGPAELRRPQLRAPALAPALLRRAGRHRVGWTGVGRSPHRLGRLQCCGRRSGDAAPAGRGTSSPAGRTVPRAVTPGHLGVRVRRRSVHGGRGLGSGAAGVGSGRARSDAGVGTRGRCWAGPRLLPVPVLRAGPAGTARTGRAVGSALLAPARTRRAGSSAGRGPLRCWWLLVVRGPAAGRRALLPGRRRHPAAVLLGVGQPCSRCLRDRSGDSRRIRHGGQPSGPTGRPWGSAGRVVAGAGCRRSDRPGRRQRPLQVGDREDLAAVHGVADPAGDVAPAGHPPRLDRGSDGVDPRNSAAAAHDLV
ncbi:MAG: hypothetical protein AVDCRST_MAG29-2647, partial [uncultured Nocardioidaceae bacterium]